MTKTMFLSVAIGCSLFAAVPAHAEVLSFMAHMDGASESPATDTKGMAMADVKVDTVAKTISWTIKASDLSGAPAAAHFHGPAAAGENAGVAIDISKAIDAGIAPITDAQMADLMAGKLYLNIHTAKFPKGEIRGQVTK